MRWSKPGHVEKYEKLSCYYKQITKAQAYFPLGIIIEYYPVTISNAAIYSFLGIHLHFNHGFVLGV